MTEPTLKKYCALAIAGWTMIIALLFGWNLFFALKNTQDLALVEARALFNKDKAARFWASDHGGVYVPVDDKTPPNPYLSHIPERDITLPSGKHLTLMNPAYMLRQMMGEYEKLYGVRGHITSLIHYRPETAPDEWEARSLKQFEAGAQEVIEISEIGGQPYLRLMQPLIANKGCLKCHGIQGYQEGDVRGGVSLSVPLAHYYDLQKQAIATLGLVYLIAWLVGVGFFLHIRKNAAGSPCA